MKDIAEDIIETDYDGLRDALSKIQYDTKTGLIVHYNDTKYEFLLNIKKDVDELLCLSSSVLKVDDLEKFHKKPLFHRLSWKFRQSTILFNDPTRYIDVDDDFTKDLQGGWSVGTYDDYFLRNIADMIVKISDFFNFSHDNILFYGSSMGGFTSLMLGTMIRDSMLWRIFLSCIYLILAILQIKSWASFIANTPKRNFLRLIINFHSWN